MVKLDTPEVRERLALLHERCGGDLQASAVVEDARDEASPLHPLFEWDDAKAAEQQRLDRAREVIRTVRVEITHHRLEIKIPAYIPAPNVRSGYLSTVQVRDDKEQKREAMMVEIDRTISLIRRTLDLGLALNELPMVQRRLAEALGLGVSSGKPPRPHKAMDGASATV